MKVTKKKSSNDFWRDRRVFITGATGLVGYCLTRELVEKGADVVALVRDRVGASEFFRTKLNERVTIVRGDVSDYLLMQRALAEYEIQTLFHLAAQTIVPIAARTPIADPR